MITVLSVAVVGWFIFEGQGGDIMLDTIKNGFTAIIDIFKTLFDFYP